MWPALGMTAYLSYGFGSGWKKGRRLARSAISSYSPWMRIGGPGMSRGWSMGIMVPVSSWGLVSVFPSTCTAALAKASTAAGSLDAAGVMEASQGFQPASGMLLFVLTLHLGQTLLDGGLVFRPRLEGNFCRNGVLQHLHLCTHSHIC